MELNFCACITSHLYFKILFVFVVGLILTFAHEIDILKSKLALFSVLFVMFMMIVTHSDECGAIVLLALLFVIIYNLNINHKHLKDNKRLN